MKTVTAKATLVFQVPDHVEIKGDEGVALRDLANIELRRKMVFGGYEPLAKLQAYLRDEIVEVKNEAGEIIFPVSNGSA